MSGAGQTAAATAANATNTDGLRQRHVISQQQTATQQQQQSVSNNQQQQQLQPAEQQYVFAQGEPQYMPQMMTAAAAAGVAQCPAYDPNSYTNMHTMATQQVIMYNTWMHQVYSQYMDQFQRQ